MPGETIPYRFCISFALV
ncbi:hypothetical protein ECPA3_3513, partial [Escherichia coli PA3]